MKMIIQSGLNIKSVSIKGFDTSIFPILLT